MKVKGEEEYNGKGKKLLTIVICFLMITSGIIVLLSFIAEPVAGCIPGVNCPGDGDTPIERDLECFIAGTKVLMADNSEKNIEDVEAGDFVKSINIQTMQLVDSEVTLLKSDYQSGIGNNFMVKITFSDGTVSQCTNNHPYYVAGKGWASYRPDVALYKYGFGTEKLTVGDIVYKYESKTLVPVRVVSISEVHEGMQTYDLVAVRPNNNFFADGMLVHNSGGCTVTDTTYSYTCYDNDVYWYDNCGGRQAKKEECGSTSIWADTGSTQWVDTTAWADTGSTQWADTTAWSDTGSTQWVSDGSACGEKEQKYQSKNQKEQKYQSKNQKEQKYQSRIVRGCLDSSCYANTEYQWVDTGSTRTVYQWVDTGSTRTVYQWVDTGSTRDVDSYCPVDAYEDSSPLETRVTAPTSVSADNLTCYVTGINTTTATASGSKQQKKQYWRDRYCSAGSCTSTLTATFKWVDTATTPTYYFRFYNVNDTTTVQDWSTNAKYTIQLSDAHDTIRVYAKAYDGTSYSSESAQTVDIVVANTAPTADFTTDFDSATTNDDLVVFTDTSTDPDGVGDIVERKWEIINAKDDAVISTSYGSSMYTQFYIAKGYKIRLTATDNLSADHVTETSYLVKQKIKLIRNSNNQGRNYIAFGAKSSILASELGAELEEYDTIQRFNESLGDWSGSLYIKGDLESDFLINRWQHLCIQVNSEVEISITPDATVDESQNITMDFTPENKGYNYITWSKGYNVTASEFVTNLSISGDTAISVYDSASNAWSTYNPSLPAVFQTDFTIEPYDVICIKGRANRESINYDLNLFPATAT